MIRYLRWQCHHMHTLSFDIINGVPTCPTCGETYQKRTKPVTTNTVTLPKEPEQEVSRFAQWAFTFIFSALGCLATAFGFALASMMTGVIIGIVLAGFFLLTSISLGILSLRENM